MKKEVILKSRQGAVRGQFAETNAVKVPVTEINVLSLVKEVTSSQTM